MYKDGNFIIHRVDYVQGNKRNLIHVGQLCCAGHREEFDDEYCYIITKHRAQYIAKSKHEGTMIPF